MKADTAFERTWFNDYMAYWTGQQVAIDQASEIPRTIVTLDHLVEDIRKSRTKPFAVCKRRDGSLFVKPTSLGVRIADAVRQLDTSIVRQCLPRHRFSPYYELWERNLMPLSDMLYGRPSVLDVEQANAAVQRMKLEADSSTFRDIVRKQERAAAKNKRSVVCYLNDLFRYGASRILVVRVDLTYPSNPWSRTSSLTVTDERVKGDLEAQLRFVQRQLKYLIGYVWKIEYGASRGYHIHFLLIFDGHRRREGITLGKIVGDHWVEVTGGSGTYWNCNAHEAEYRHRGLRGIGLINYDQVEERGNLINVGAYLAKMDCYSRFISPTIGRTFGKGELKRDELTRGRPRAHLDAVAGNERSDAVEELSERLAKEAAEE